MSRIHLKDMLPTNAPLKSLVGNLRADRTMELSTLARRLRRDESSGPDAQNILRHTLAVNIAHSRLRRAIDLVPQSIGTVSFAQSNDFIKPQIAIEIVPAGLEIFDVSDDEKATLLTRIGDLILAKGLDDRVIVAAVTVTSSGSGGIDALVNHKKINTIRGVFEDCKLNGGSYDGSSVIVMAPDGVFNTKKAPHRRFADRHGSVIPLGVSANDITSAITSRFPNLSS